MFEENRIDPRVRLALPLQLGTGKVVVTRDISTSGLYFETSDACEIGFELVFELHLTEARLKFTAHGEVVRMERRHGGTGVAVRLVNPRLEPTE